MAMSVNDYSAAESSSSSSRSNSLGQERLEQQQHTQEQAGSCARYDSGNTASEEVFRSTKRMKTQGGGLGQAAARASVGTLDESSSHRSLISDSKRLDAYSSTGYSTGKPKSGEGTTPHQEGEGTHLEPARTPSGEQASTFGEGTRLHQEGEGTPVEPARLLSGQQASAFAASDQRSFLGSSSLGGFRNPTINFASSLQALAAAHLQGVSPFMALRGGDNLILNPMFSNDRQSNTRGSNELSDTILRYQALLSQLQSGRAAIPSIFGSLLASSDGSQQKTHPASSNEGASQRQPQSIGLSFGTGGLSPCYSEPAGNRFIGEAIHQLLMQQQMSVQRFPQEHSNQLLGCQLGLSAGLAQQSALQRSNQSPAWSGNSSSSLRGDLLYGGRQQNSGLAVGAATGARSRLSSQTTVAASGLSAVNNNLSEEDQQQFWAPVGPDGFPLGLPVIIAHPEDMLSKLSDLQLLLRRQIEVFHASADDMSTHTRGRNKPIIMGKIGIRCRHCAHIPVGKRQKGSTYFPATILGLYQAAQNMSTIHLQCGLCSEMPVGLKQQFVYLISTKAASSGAGSRAFWARSAEKLGLADTDDGIRFVRDLLPEKRPRQTIDGSIS